MHPTESSGTLRFQLCWPPWSAVTFEPRQACMFTEINRDGTMATEAMWQAPDTTAEESCSCNRALTATVTSSTTSLVLYIQQYSSLINCDANKAFNLRLDGHSVALSVGGQTSHTSVDAIKDWHSGRPNSRRYATVVEFTMLMLGLLRWI